MVRAGGDAAQWHATAHGLGQVGGCEAAVAELAPAVVAETLHDAGRLVGAGVVRLRRDARHRGVERRARSRQDARRRRGIEGKARGQVLPLAKIPATLPRVSRPLQIEFPGAVYHVTARGDRREPIYRDDADRTAQLHVIAQAMERFDSQVLAYCQMGNQFHRVPHSRQGKLSRLMRHINGVDAQQFNRRHGLVGHLFQGRFKAILVDRYAYLMVLCRYVQRNPVAAGRVATADEWAWSSDRAHVCMAPTPSWLDSDGLHGYLLGRSVASERDRARAAQKYAALVTDADEGEASLWQTGLRQQV